MKNLIYITFYAFTLFTGIFTTQFIEKVKIRKQKIDNMVIRLEAEKIKFPHVRFILAENITDNSQLSDWERGFADNCIKCETDDITVYHNSESPERIRYILDFNCGGEKNVIERGFLLNEKIQKIGEHCLIIYPSGKVRIFQTENEKDYWIIQATSLSLAKEFENSETFRLAKSGIYPK